MSRTPTFDPPPIRRALIFLTLLTFLFGASSLAADPETRNNQSDATIKALIEMQMADLERIEEDRAKRANDFVKQGTALYEQTRFSDALPLYERALDLRPQSNLLQALVTDTRHNLRMQQALRSDCEAKNWKFSDVVQARYRSGCELYAQQRYIEARRQFYQAWLLGADYRSTLEYLTRIGRAIRAQSAAPAPKTPDPKQTASGSAAEDENQENTSIATSLAGKGWLWGRDESQPDKTEITETNPAPASAENEIATIEEPAVARVEKRPMPESRKMPAIANLETPPIVLASDIAAPQTLEEEDSGLGAAVWIGKGWLWGWGGDETDKETINEPPLDIELAPAPEVASPRLAREEEIEERERRIALTLDSARQALKASEFDRASNLYDQVLTLDPDEREAIEGRQRIIEKRLEMGRKALAQEIEANLEAARQAYEEENYDQSIALYETVLRRDLNNRSARRGHEKALKAREKKIDNARQEEENKKSHLAQAERDALEEKISENLDRARAASKLGRFDDALKLYQIVLDMDASNGKAMNGLEEAREEQLKAAERQRSEGENLEKIAIERAELQESERRRQSTASRRAAFESEIAARLEKARQAYVTANYTQAIEFYQSVLNMDADNSLAKSGCKRSVAAKAKADEKQKQALEARLRRNQQVAEASAGGQEKIIYADASARRRAFEREIAARLDRARDAGDMEEYMKTIEQYQSSLKSPEETEKVSKTTASVALANAR